MKIQGKRGNQKVLGCGVHLVAIFDIKLARNHKGELRTTKFGDMGIDIVFRDNKHVTHTSTFWLSEKSKWVLDSLCKAAGLPTDKQIDAEEAKGKTLYIVIAEEYRLFDGEREKDLHGNIICNYKIIPKFFPPVMEPLIEGDPKYNNSIPSGVFLIEKPYV